MDEDISNRNYELEEVGDTTVLQLYADEFEHLTKKDRLLSYYLMQAALAGRDIYYDQLHRNSLEIRGILEEIITHSEGINQETINSILNYTKLFWINSSNYLERTKLKFIPNFSHEIFREALKKAVENGAKIPATGSNQTIDQIISNLKKVIFDPEYEPLITRKSLSNNDDIITGSANNFYCGISLSDLENFNELYPQNSRLIKIDGLIVEQVYRAGDESGNTPPGLYKKELSHIIECLQKAIIFASKNQQKALLALIEYFKAGDEELFNRYNINWLADNPEVDTILGFIEVYKDARGSKGTFEAIIYCIDHNMTDLMQKISQNAQYFEDKAPWNDKYKKEHVATPSSIAISVIFGTGDGGPHLPLGINLPNSQALREKYGSKSFILTNVLSSINSVVGNKIVDEFVLEGDKEIVKKYQILADIVHVAMHEILGHGSGKANPELKNEPAVHLKEYYSTLEEARADLTALFHLFDPRLIELGLIPNKDVAHVGYLMYATSDLLILRHIKSDTIEDDHMRATHLIISYLIEEIKAIEPIIHGEKLYFNINSYERMHEGVKKLLSELMRIKAEGDYVAAKDLICRYGIKINTYWRDQITQRSKDIGIPDYFAFVMPTLTPIRNRAGEIIDAKVTYGEDFMTQMLKYSGKIL